MTSSSHTTRPRRDGLRLAGLAACRAWIAVATIAWSAAAPGVAATFTVNSAGDTDDGACDAAPDCTLREAINAANVSAGADTIAFDITGAGCIPRIAVDSLLPVISDNGTTLDGTTQTDCNAGTLGSGGTVGVGPDGIPGTGDEIALPPVPAPDVEIVDNNNVTRGLEIRAANVTLRGIAIFGFGNAPFNSNQGNVLVEPNGGTPSANFVLEQSVLGLTALGTPPPGTDVNPNFNIFIRSGSGRISTNLISNSNVSAMQFRDVGSAGSGPSAAVLDCDPADPNLTYLIAGNEIVFNALESGISDGVDINSVHGLCVRGNLIEDTGGVGVDIGGNSIVEENTVRRSGLATDNPYTQDPQNDQWSGMRTTFDDNTIRRNLIADERLGAVSVERSARGHAITFRGSQQEALYLVSTVDRLGAPGIARRRTGDGITRGKATYLILVHAEFRDGIRPLVARREVEGWRVKVVDVGDVYARFSHGHVDAAGIRAYLAHAAKHMGTEMVLLVGGDSYDYHDYLGLGSRSFIPSPYVATGSIVSFAPADPAYADVDGDGAPDLAIGRLPVRTPEALEEAVAKTLDYPGSTYGRTGVFAADRADLASATSFASLTESLVCQLPAGWSVERVYLDQMEIGAAREALTGAINQGVALTSFFGHSGPTVWSFDALFTTADVGELDNHRMPTVVVQWGCWNTYYVSPTVESMGTKLLAGPQGAAAVLGATTLTHIRSDITLARLLMPLITRPGMSIGLALRDAKRELAERHPEMADVLLGWTLLGDPALVLTEASVRP